MKILFLYRYIPTYDFDNHLHMLFARFIANYPGVELKAYGPQLHVGYPDINLIRYDRQYTMKGLHLIFNFDIVIICTKSRCFLDYNPHIKIAKGNWLPYDFKDYKCPKIVLEEDYHYETDDQWYQEVKIDLILQRHYSQSLRQNKVPMKFFPFSVDTSIFNSHRIECIHQGKVIKLPNKRHNKFAFIGSCQDKAYAYRKQATTVLKQNGLLDDHSNDDGVKIVDGEYLELLRKYKAYVSCGSTLEICAGKNFEIMGAGGILFTNRFLGIDLLFPENSYCSYNIDGSNVVEKARRVLNDNDYAIELAKNSRECITQRHSHDVRVKELLQILKELK